MYASITSTRARFRTPVYISQGLEANTEITVSYNSPIVARFTVDAAHGNVVTFGTIECYNGITTDGYITCNALATTTIYTNTATDNMLTPKATTSYVHAQLLLQASQATTYTKQRPTTC